MLMCMRCCNGLRVWVGELMLVWVVVRVHARVLHVRVWVLCACFAPIGHFSALLFLYDHVSCICCADIAILLRPLLLRLFCHFLRPFHAARCLPFCCACFVTLCPLFAICRDHLLLPLWRFVAPICACALWPF